VPRGNLQWAVADFRVYGAGMTEIADLEAALAAVPAATGRAAPPRFADGRASLILDVTGLDIAARDALQAGVDRALTAEKTGIRIIAVASGKGGVGKSTVATNLAIALARSGLKVGLVDADIYGPSQPRLMATEGKRPEARDKKLVAIPTQFGVPMLSMGHLVAPGKAIAWRGPMAGNALRQLIDANWGDTELLIIDLPPGTGDVQMTMIAQHKPVGAVIVSTPQDLALIDATRAIDLFDQAGVPIIGIVENMAGYQCPSCGEISDPFGSGGAEATAARLDHPFLGRIPLDIAIRTASDAGEPPVTPPFVTIADQVRNWLQSR
jgi:ATP-binding protein involved in chromosome partitioning